VKRECSWLARLPESLRVAAYYAEGEAAWPAEEALSAVQCATELGVAVCGVEVWLATASRPTIPTPHVYTWEFREQEPQEAWLAFVRRANHEATEYIRSFSWDPRDQAHRGLEPYFNLDIVCNREEG